MAAPQPFIEAHLKYYYEVQAAVDVQITRVLDALQDGGAYENTIVIFSSDHGDMHGRSWRRPPEVAQRLRGVAAESRSSCRARCCPAARGS